MSVFIASGVTSNLFASLLPFLAGYTIYAVKPRKEIPAYLNRVLFEDPQDISTPVLWLSTHDDTATLSMYRGYYKHVLAISSCSIMDYIRGIQSEDSLNAYQKSKLSVTKVPGLVTFFPGFYIEDMRGLPEGASKGLHGDSTVKIFSGEGTSGFDWNKNYSVTPKSYIVDACLQFIKEPSSFKENTPIIVCSDRAYRRWELAQLAGVEVEEGDAAPTKELIYEKFDHGGLPLVTHEKVQKACIRARQVLLEGKSE